jgi:hypothetical protein
MFQDGEIARLWLLLNRKTAIINDCLALKQIAVSDVLLRGEAAV